MLFSSNILTAAVAVVAVVNHSMALSLMQAWYKCRTFAISPLFFSHYIYLYLFIESLKCLRSSDLLLSCPFPVPGLHLFALIMKYGSRFTAAQGSLRLNKAY